MSGKTRAAGGTQDVFAQMTETIEQAMKSSRKLQEDAWKWWSQASGQAPSGVGAEWAEKMKEIFDSVAPSAKKTTEATLNAFDEISKNSLELLTKAFDASPGETDKVRDQVREVWETSVAAFRKNAETLAEANERVVTMWTSYIDRFTPETPPAGAKSGETGSKV